MRTVAPTGTDVLVVGSGAAGLTAALAAAADGARVLLAERSARLGGTTALSFGRVWVPANHYCPDDTPDAARRYLAAVFGADHPRMIEAFVAAAPLMALFAERRSPLVFTPCVNYPDYHPAMPGAAPGGRALDITLVSRSSLTPLADALRTPPGYLPLTHDEWERWRFPDRFDWPLLAERSRDGVLAGGAALAAALLDGAVGAGVQVRASTRLHDVRLGPDGAVSAATVSAEGRTEDVPVSAVILATGGFDRDASLRARFLPASVAATGAAPGNTGDALRIAAAAGARIENTGQGWWMPMVEIPGQTIDGQPVLSVADPRALAAASDRGQRGRAPLHRRGAAVQRILQGDEQPERRGRLPEPGRLDGLRRDVPAPLHISRGQARCRYPWLGARRRVARRPGRRHPAPG